MTTAHEIAKEACDKHTHLIDVLAHVAVWECDRAVRQAKNSENGGYETCFRAAFRIAIREYLGKSE